MRGRPAWSEAPATALLAGALVLLVLACTAHEEPRASPIVARRLGGDSVTPGPMIVMCRPDDEACIPSYAVFCPAPPSKDDVLPGPRPLSAQEEAFCLEHAPDPVPAAPPPVSFATSAGGPPAPMEKRVPYHVTRSPGELLSAWVRDMQLPVAPGGAAGDMTHILIYHADYPRQDVDSLLRGLQQLALTGEPARLRAEAALRVAMPGYPGPAVPLAGTFARLERIYRRSSDVLVRTAVVGAMAHLVERREALAFLELVAAREPQLAGRAIAALLFMDDEGRAALKRLHDSGAIGDPEARMDLETLAKHDYRIQR